MGCADEFTQDVKIIRERTAAEPVISEDAGHGAVADPAAVWRPRSDCHHRSTDLSLFLRLCLIARRHRVSLDDA
jgi:hypothetical protein